MNASDIYDKYASLTDPADLIYIGRDTIIEQISQIDPTENAELAADAILAVAADLMQLNSMISASR